MKPSSFKIKVSDLLKKPGSRDTVVFENKFSLLIPGLTEDGISGEIELVTLDKLSLQTTLRDIKVQINDTCDMCGTVFKRDVNIDTYEAEFIIGEESKNDEEEQEDFVINSKDETIDIEKMIVQAIILNEPLVKLCPLCLQKRADEEDDSDYEFYESDNALSNNPIIIK